MKSRRLVPVLLVLTLVAAWILESPACAEGPKVVEAELETPFVLAVGETGRVEPDGLEVTLRSASDDSGCLAPNDCSVASFNGTIAMRLNDQSDLATVQAMMGPGQGVSLTFAGYEISFGDVRRLGKDRVQATFTVTKAPEEEKKENEPGQPGRASRCRQRSVASAAVSLSLSR
jgi:hypothetical protein